MAARIAGVNIPMHKHIRIGLRAVFGIGPTMADKICAMSNVEGSTKVKDLTEQQLDALRSNVDTLKTEGDLRREISLNIKRKMDLGTYEGRRHRSGLPLRKRTKTNARTRKGKKKPIK